MIQVITFNNKIVIALNPSILDSGGSNGLSRSLGQLSAQAFWDGGRWSWQASFAQEFEKREAAQEYLSANLGTLEEYANSLPEF